MGLEAILTANDVINHLVREDFTDAAYERATEITAKFYSEGAAKSRHVVHAMGHCHIDTGECTREGFVW